MKVYNKLCVHFIGYELGIRSVCTSGLCPELRRQCDVCTEVGISILSIHADGLAVSTQLHSLSINHSVPCSVLHLRCIISDETGIGSVTTWRLHDCAQSYIHAQCIVSNEISINSVSGLSSRLLLDDL